MTQQRAVRLLHLLTLALALGIIGFSEADRNQATGVPSQDGRGVCLDLSQKIKR